MSQIIIGYPTQIDNQSDLFQVAITNNKNEPNQLVRIDVVASINGRPIYQAQTRPVTLNPGMNQFSYELLQPIQVELNDLNSVTKGEKVIYEVKLIENNTIIARERKSVTLNLNKEEKTTLGEAVSDNLTLQGNINILGQLSDRQGVGSQVPQNYLRSNGNATLALSEIPVDFGYFLSTEQSPLRQSINRATLKLNVPMLKQNLKSRVDKKIQAGDTEIPAPTDQEMKEFKEYMLKKRYPDYAAHIAYSLTEAGISDIEAIRRILVIEQVEFASSTKKAIQRFKRLMERNNPKDKFEKEKLHLFILEVTRLQLEKKSLLEGLSMSRENAEQAYHYLNNAEAYYEGLDIIDYKRANTAFNPFVFLNKTQKFLDMFQGVSIGTTNPYFSRLTLSGLLVNGVSVELTPGKFYVAGVFGRSTRETLDQRFTIPDLTLKQNTFGVKLGYGIEGDNHIHASFVDIQDIDSDFTPLTNTTPQSNRLIGLSGGLTLLNNALNLRGEWVGSLVERDAEAPLLDNSLDPKRIPLAFLYPELKSTSFYDQAFSFDATYNIQELGLNLDGNIEQLNPEFQTLGSPTLVSNVLRWQAGARKSLLDNKIQLGLRAQRIDNSLDPLLSQVNNITESYGADLTLAFPDLPQVFLSYAPYAQNSLIRATGEEQFSDSRVANASISYPYQIGSELNLNTQATYYYQELTSNIPNADNLSQTFGLNQSINYKNLGLSIGYTNSPNQQFGDGVQDLQTLNVNGNLSIDKFSANGGMQLLNIRDVENKIGYQLSASYQITDFITFDLRGLRNIYEPNANQLGFNENILQSGLRITFGGDSQQEKPLKSTKQENSEQVVLDSQETNSSNEQQLAFVESEVQSPPITEENEKTNEDIEVIGTQEKQRTNEDRTKEDTRPQAEKKAQKKTQKSELISTSKKPHYKILLGVELDPDKSFLSIAELGPVTNEEVGNLYAYYLGYFNDEAKAQERLETVKRRGYPSAKLLYFDQGTLQKEVIQEDPPEEKEIIKAEDSVEEDKIEEIFVEERLSYHVLFRVLNNPNEKFNDLKKIGPLYRETYDDQGNTRYLIGDVPTEDEARILLDRMKQKGYKTTFIVEYQNGKLKKYVD